MTTTSVTPTASFMGASGFHHKRISWASIFAGLLVALGIQLILSLLGMGIGMGAINPLRDRNPVAGMGIGALLWWGITFLIALFVGGWIAGRLSRTRNVFETRMQGILTFVAFVMVNVYIMGSAAGSILNTAGAVVGREDSATIRNQVGAASATPAQTEARARQTADDVASALSKAGIYAFAGLLLGALVATMGAGMGRGTRFDDYDYDELTQGRGNITTGPGSPTLG